MKLTILISILTILSVSCSYQKKNNQELKVGSQQTKEESKLNVISRQDTLSKEDVPASNFISQQDSSLPEKLKKFSGIISKNELDFHVRDGSRDTTLIVKNLFPFDDSLKNPIYAILIERNSWCYNPQTDGQNTNVYFYRNVNNKWIKISSYLRIETGFDYEFSYEFEVLAAHTGLSFLLQADKNGSSHVFIPNKTINTVKKLNGTYVYSCDTYPFIGVVSVHDTSSNKYNDLPMDYNISEKYYTVKSDSLIFHHARYNSIKNNYLITKWVDLGGKNQRQRYFCDSVCIDDIYKAKSILNKLSLY